MSTQLIDAPAVAPVPIPTAAPQDKYFKLFREYSNRAALLEEVHRAFVDGIELLAGKECRRRCEDEGLAGMHRHYPAEHVHLLEAFVDHRMRRRMMEWSAAIGRHDVGFSGDFLVQDLLVVRVHYPHASLGQRPSSSAVPRLYHRLRWGLPANLERFREAYGSGSAWKLTGRMYEYLRERRRRAALPLPYRCHAPHLDSWLGQPITSLSVWLAIAGVDVQNSMCLYPETMGAALPVSGSRFLGSGYCLPKPFRPAIQDGDLFVFSTDILHSSQLNVSDKTRVALTTRIDSGTPVFSQESLWFVERWYSANAILDEGRWRRTIVRGSRNAVPRRPAESKPAAGGGVRIASPFRAGGVYAVGPADAIHEGDKFVVEFEDQKRILIIRTGGRLKAFSARCPHAGYRMDEGHHDDCVLTCPGHGLEFDARTGASPLRRYRLAMFTVSERDGIVYLEGVDRSPR